MEESKRFDLGPQIPFGKLAVPERMGMDPEAYGDITLAMIEHMTPGKLRPDLIGLPRDSRYSVGYRDGGSGDYIRIALTPIEYKKMPRNVSKLAEIAITTTQAARPYREEFDTDQAAAKRAGVHAIESKLPRMISYVSETLEPDLDRLTRFDEYARNRNLRRTKGVDMLIELEWIRSHIFEDTFIALRNQRDWSAEQERFARRTLDKKLFLEPDLSQRTLNWQEMLGFEKEYWGHKLALFKTRIWESKKYISDNDESLR